MVIVASCADTLRERLVHGTEDCLLLRQRIGECRATPPPHTADEVRGIGRDRLEATDDDRVATWVDRPEAAKPLAERVLPGRRQASSGPHMSSRSRREDPSAIASAASATLQPGEWAILFVHRSGGADRLHTRDRDTPRPSRAITRRHSTGEPVRAKPATLAVVAAMSGKPRLAQVNWQRRR